MISEKNLKKALNKKVSWFFWPSLGGVGGSTPHPLLAIPAPNWVCIKENRIEQTRQIN